MIIKDAVDVVAVKSGDGYRPTVPSTIAGRAVSRSPIVHKMARSAEIYGVKSRGLGDMDKGIINFGTICTGSGRLGRKNPQWNDRRVDIQLPGWITVRPSERPGYPRYV